MFLIILKIKIFAAATPEQAQETHAAIRQYLGQIAGADVAAETRILYGGSASGKTAPDLSKKEDIDGKFGWQLSDKGTKTLTLSNSSC